VAAGIHSTAGSGDQALPIPPDRRQAASFGRQNIGAKLYGAGGGIRQPIMSRCAPGRTFPVFPSREIEPQNFREKRFAFGQAAFLV
jgi:hypothetical protein